MKWTIECQLMFPSSQCCSVMWNYLETSRKISPKEEGESQ